ncbi:alcohol dehydrogenase catalytic domain-containing protein [Paraburkholderia sp. BL9I2N2]|uniref:alcohol dehydrogenase catalytic domain-containing protein n=1 Tax=Paraburkholderia sp. BL9I2N2 TaxID=1938809 RepID=UPI00104AA9C7|nr:alcohol dehydrogenase catalytic domain-containing protein [Paraburkholderia sp. BL9I2N2]TCK84268.1 NADPH2:quinone reductase [Paraburkholderia sp. BL9I2N2]
MKAIVFARFGEPEKVLEMKTLPDPTPPGLGEVLIRVTKRQLHPGNLMMVRGMFQIPLPANGFLIPGADGVGIVEAVGEGVDAARVKPGMRVIFNPSPGAWAERLKAPAELVTPIPDDLPDAIAAQMGPNAVIALMLLRAAQRAAPDAGREIPILLNAAGSSVARFVTIAAQRRGLNVVGAVRSAKGAKALSDRFPDLPVVSTADPDWLDQVRHAAGARPLQVVMDPVGGAMVSEIVPLLGDGGALLLYGAMAPDPVIFPMSAVPREIMFAGVSSSRWMHNTSAEQRREDVGEAIEIGRGAPEKFEVEADYDLAQFANAIEHIERENRHGAVLLSSDL